MILLKDAKITDALPRIIAEQPWAQAMAYAIGKQLSSIIDMANGAFVSAGIDYMPDAVLDALAVEMRLPYYKQSYLIDVKRTLIKGAIKYWATVGTVDSLSVILHDIFGDAEIEEWFTYEGDPGKFKIVTTNPNITGDTLTEFEQTAHDVKRLSAWLESVSIDISVPTSEIYRGAALHDLTDLYIQQEG